MISIGSEGAYPSRVRISFCRLAGEKLPLHEGFSIDLRTVDVSRWERFRVDGAIINVTGRGDCLDFWLLELRDQTVGSRDLCSVYAGACECQCEDDLGVTQLCVSSRTSRVKRRYFSDIALPVNVEWA